MSESTRRRRKRLERHRAGLCRDCSQPRAVGSIFCAPHRDADRARARAYKRWCAQEAA